MMEQMQLSRFSFADGVSLSQVASTVYKTNYLTFCFALPLDEDTAAKSAVLAHLLSSSCEKYPDVQALRRARASLYNAEISADVSAIGETQILTLSCVFLKDAYALDGESILEEVFALCGEILFHPLLKNGMFPEELCAREKKNAADDARATLNTKSAYAIRRLTETMCAQERYAADPLGKPARIEALTSEELVAFYKRLLHEARCEIFFVGESPEKLLQNAVRALFSSLERKYNPLPKAELKSAPQSVNEVFETLPLEQAHLVMGFRTPLVRPNPQYAALSLCNVLFGGSASSKLFMNVREKLSLCYTVHSFPEPQKGVLFVYAGIDAQNRQKAITEIYNQLLAVQNGEVSDEEFSCAKNLLLSALRALQNTPNAIASFLLSRILCGIENPQPEAEIQAIESLTREEVSAAARTLVPDTVYFLSGGAR